MRELKMRTFATQEEAYKFICEIGSKNISQISHPNKGRFTVLYWAEKEN